MAGWKDNKVLVRRMRSSTGTLCMIILLALTTDQ